MATDPAVQDVVSNAVNNVSTAPKSNDLSLESLTLLINAERLRNLENKITNEFVELKKRQDKVSFLYKVLKTINNATNNDQLDCSNHQELKDLLIKAKEAGVEIPDGKHKFNEKERERLIENIKMTSDDYNVLNDMQLQTISRLTTERYESYQLARSIMKPLHEDKVNKSRAMAGK